MDPLSVSAALPAHNDLLRPGAETAALPAPPAGLVQKFEALMSQSPAEGSVPVSQTPLVEQAVAHVNNHLQHHVDIIDRVTLATSGELSVSELQVLQLRSTVELGVMSMNQAAYMQVLGSTKSTVSALMKNQ